MLIAPSLLQQTFTVWLQSLTVLCQTLPFVLYQHSCEWPSSHLPSSSLLQHLPLHHLFEIHSSTMSKCQFPLCFPFFLPIALRLSLLRCVFQYTDLHSWYLRLVWPTHRLSSPAVHVLNRGHSSSRLKRCRVIVELFPLAAFACTCQTWYKPLSSGVEGHHHRCQLWVSH